MELIKMNMLTADGKKLTRNYSPQAISCSQIIMCLMDLGAVDCWNETATRREFLPLEWHEKQGAKLAIVMRYTQDGKDREARYTLKPRLETMTQAANAVKDLIHSRLAAFGEDIDILSIECAGVRIEYEDLEHVMHYPDSLYPALAGIAESFHASVTPGTRESL